MQLNKHSNPILTMVNGGAEDLEEAGDEKAVIVVACKWRDVVEKFPGIAVVKKKFGA